MGRALRDGGGPVSGLLVMVPARGRRANCERLLASFRETASPGTDLVFILDEDDAATYEGVEWGDALAGVLAPRAPLGGKLNQTAQAMAGAYPALMWCEDDYVFTTPGWDVILLAALDDLGGDGWVYPDTVRRRDVPEIWMASASVVGTLGWFFPPAVSQFYADNAIAELGKRAGLLRFCPEVVVEHLHYAVRTDVERDAVYLEAEAAHGGPDLAAFHKYRADQMPHDVSLLRRKFSRDVAWVLGKVA